MQDGMAPNQTSQSNAINATERIHPGASTLITINCTPLVDSVNLPVGSPSILVNEHLTPPSYEDTVDPNAAPPSYESLFGRIRETHRASKGVFDFFKNILILLLGTIGCTIILGLMIAIPTSMMVIGGLYLYDCPQAEYIPIFLLVGGGFNIFKKCLRLSSRVVNQIPEERGRPCIIETLVNCFLFVWFILGSVWVYREYEPNYDPALGKYCNKTLYLFAFWLITLSYIIFAMVTVSACSISVLLRYVE